MSEHKFERTADIGLKINDPTSAAKKEELFAKPKQEENDDKENSGAVSTEQCFLMSIWEKLAQQNIEAPADFQSSIEQSGIPKSYSNFLTIEHVRPYEFVNKLFKKHKDADQALRLTSTQLSFMVPYIRLYKVYKNPNTDSYGQEACVELPFDSVLNKGRLDNLTKTGAGRGGGVGIDSFKWVSMGDHPGTKFQYRATLKLYLQSIEELFEVRAIKKIFGQKEIEVKYSDLVVVRPSLRKTDNEGPDVYDPDYYQIRAVVGWNVMQERGARQLFSPTELDVINRAKYVFNLNLVSHELDIEEDGSLYLTADYITTAESILNNPAANESNILRGANTEKIEKIQTAIEAHRIELSDLTSQKNDDNSDNKALSGKIENVEEVIKTLENRLNEIISQDKISLYSEITNTLFRKGEIKHVTFPKELLKKRVDVQTDNQEETASQITAEKFNRIEQERKDRNEQVQFGYSYYDVSDSFYKAVTKENEDGNIKILYSDESNPVQQLDAISAAEKKKGDDKNKTIYYFYLGALLDAVLDGMFMNNPGGDVSSWLNKKVRLICGPVTFYDYGAPEKVGRVTELNGKKVDGELIERYRGKMSSINLVDIPISMTEWTSWFNNFITDKGKTMLSFQDFLTEIIRDVFVSAINSQCVDFAPRQDARISFRGFAATRDKQREEYFSTIGSNGNMTTRLELTGIDEHPFVHNGRDVCSSGANVDNYILIYGINNIPWDLTSDIKEDKNRGIFHLFYGNEYGLVKKINFKKEDIPGLEESNLYNATVDGWRPGRILRKKYNADVEMIGNTIFEPGQFVYILPSIGGSGNLGARVKQVKELGIGGYFQILGITNSINSSGFDTTLETKWVATGDGTLNVRDKAIGTFIVRNAGRLNRNTPDSKTVKSDAFSSAIEYARGSTGER